MLLGNVEIIAVPAQPPQTGWTLQYRCRNVIQDVFGKIQDLGWSPWKDVPKVENINEISEDR